MFNRLVYRRLVAIVHRVTGQLKEGTMGGVLQYVYNIQSRNFCGYSLAKFITGLFQILNNVGIISYFLDFKFVDKIFLSFNFIQKIRTFPEYTYLIVGQDCNSQNYQYHEKRCYKYRY